MKFAPAFILLPTLFSAVFGTETAQFEKTLKPLLNKHCIDCHGPDVAKAKLRLDQLKPDFNSPDSAELLTKVVDKMASGQMPPPSEERPPKEALDATIKYLTQNLHDASLARQQSEGRVVLRRLNQVEYENTLSDLMEMNVDIKDYLPDDNVVGGFDNISAGLSLSSSHFFRYQEAAEKVLAAAVPFRYPPKMKERKTGLQISENNQGLKGNIGQSAIIAGDAYVSYAKFPRYSALITPPAPMNGRYRVRISAYALNTKGKNLSVALIYFPELTRDEGEVRGAFEVPPDKAAVREVELDLQFREKLVINPWSLPYEGDFKREHKDGVKDCTAPALAFEWVELEGPIDPAPGPGYRRLFGDVPLKPRSVVNAESKKAKPPVIKETRSEYEWAADPLVPVSENPKKDAERLLRDFIPRAARRPVAAADIEYFITYANARLDKGYTFGEAMLSTYKAVLCSSHFLFMNELPGKLDDYALASRLAYFLWRSAPDATLMDLADKKQLSKREVLTSQVERMLNDPKSQRFVEDFTGLWLELRKIHATSPDPQLYGEFDQYLLWSMPRETHLFFAEVLKSNLSVLNFIKSDWTFVNERLAQHYGIREVAGSDFKKVALPACLHRGGVLTQASVLKVTADGTRTSPIIRGKWVLEHVVGKPPPPPPPDVPAIEPDIRGATTIRQQLEKHRSTKACASCHNHIDPPGFALETFDVIGGWREFYRASKASNKKSELENYPGRKVNRGPDVEKGDKTPDGKIFKDIDDYKDILLEDKDQIARNLIEKLMTFATGAEIQFADREVVEQIVAEAKKNNYGLRTIVHQIIASRVFLNK